jgi:2-dehydropantoate 2-reductase
MRILILGAGAVGGYFGGRLLKAGRDVTFLVRPGRAERLARTGLVVRSPYGDVEIQSPPTVTTDAIEGPYDVVLLSCKAYDLDSAIDSIAPAVGPSTSIVPLLNGIRQLDVLDGRFDAERVLGGFAVISSVVDDDGRVLHLNRMHSLTFGARRESQEGAAVAIATELGEAGFDSSLSDAIVQEMWEKWVFIAAGAGVTCLMRASVGTIVRVAGRDLASTMLEETGFIAAANGFPPRSESYQRSLAILTEPDSPLMASMLRDVEAGSRTEADHILGDLIRRGPGSERTSPMLRLAYAHLRAYEERRANALRSPEPSEHSAATPSRSDGGTAVD